MPTPIDAGAATDASDGMTRAGWTSVVRRVGACTAFVLIAAALAYVFRDLSFAAIWSAMMRQSSARLATCLALTTASFACLALYDVAGVHIAARQRVPPGLALLAGATSAAVANTLGFHAASASAVRAHLYLPAGLTRNEVAGVVSMSWLCLVAGNMTVLAGAEFWQASTGADSAWHTTLGVGIAGLLLLWLAWLSRGAREIALGRLRLPMPTASMGLMLMMLGAFESATALAALYVLLPSDLAPPFDVFAVGCIGAVILGVVSHSPGGLGVFEASMAAILGAHGRSDLMAALLVFRLSYNLLPFSVAVLILGLRVGHQRLSARNRVRRQSGP